jgi:hypothetical protein
VEAGIWLTLGFCVVATYSTPFALAIVLRDRAEDSFRLSMIGPGGDMKVSGRTAWSARSQYWRSCSCSGPPKIAG